MIDDEEQYQSQSIHQFMLEVVTTYILTFLTGGLWLVWMLVRKK
ncbi:gp094 [Rhodococcus phage ReqiPepy6]|uniref:Gp095 n=2 Tax=Pepyhexavirus TaxID=1982367 RepID=D4P7W3_9CAUD|nr:gp095 [Rhodococcus phage ReqiPoco6]YP_009017708.1 gp094 [Rhodococcus phage ReqiPepy6]ADD80985.1 gp094 [Rhodococcus phage ReqiPepy6]ADD81093.1 gp095 [Rhodococcus phage ReqiPoco6]